jgi:hypothetical protein
MNERMGGWIQFVLAGAAKGSTEEKESTESGDETAGGTKKRVVCMHAVDQEHAAALQQLVLDTAAFSVEWQRLQQQ